ncbi:coenzyme F420-0:L-glutamate ligase [Lactobacillus xylocopicola]|uniref:Coenzyme F420:L-glutamate ligase-like domain-containing protein n=1 Tax=Lactobacillus xylocopicola TaxID=2976676 RepID=A0ABM8BFE5_9LACO|nr:coenzyme F420-0:L-glutamate ligase [Lactobacillus xylocopicola]BDR59974.1 hypothetical protein KIM322_02350 [Lactobacillus xylocopicola]
MIEINGLHGVPQISEPGYLPKILVETIKKENFTIAEGDVLCVASKLCSIAEGNVIELGQVRPSVLAQKIHAQIPRKDARLIQVVIDQTGDPTGNSLEIADNYLGAWLSSGLFLTSGGVDKGQGDTVITLPQDCDRSAREIRAAIFAELGIRTSVIITDSDGRVDKKGATQVAIGLSGLSGLRVNEHTHTSETLCDLLAAAAGLVMGQRGVNIPLVCIHGLDYEKSLECGIGDVVNGR